MIDSIIDQIKQSTNYQINKKILKEKILTELHMPYNNGLFKISPELFAFVSVWPDENLFIEDVYENPIFIEKSSFLNQAKEHYFSVMNKWHIQHEELKKTRKV